MACNELFSVNEKRHQELDGDGYVSEECSSV